MKQRHITLIGAGLVGSLMTILLAKRGYKVDVYERRSDMRKAGFVGGRSINLAMSNRGWEALEKAGIAEDIRKVAIPMNGRMMHSVEGEQTFQPYGKEGQAIYSVSRGGLNLELLNLTEQFPDVHLHFDQRCRKVELENHQVHFEGKDGAQKTVPVDICLGTDGAFSAVRSTMQRQNRFNYSQHYLDYGYKELEVPPNPDGSHRIDKNALHIWPRGNFMLIALPNVDGSFTCTLFLPFEGKEAFEHLHSDEQILDFFNRFFKDAVPLMPDLLQDFKQNPTSSLVTIRCNPWHYDHRFLIFGDASHAIVPFYGQGMNSGFEDCSILDRMLGEHEGDWAATIEQFNAERPKDADAIADLALRNFIEMRDLVADPMFLLRKKIEAWLQDEYPDRFLPLYSQVTFSHIPYSKALEEGQAQDRLFDRILSLDNIEENWQSDEVKRIFEQWLDARSA
jgi:kynurenine 3-monooxygenase